MLSHFASLVGPFVVINFSFLLLITHGDEDRMAERCKESLNKQTFSSTSPKANINYDRVCVSLAACPLVAN